MKESPWQAPKPLGYLESTQTVGGFAAPLLAGTSFTLAVLALQWSAVSRWADIALVLFIGAGLAQLATIQCTAWSRRFMCTPAELADWHPAEMTDGVPSPWLRNVQKSHFRQAVHWAHLSRLSFHLGIFGLLGGIVIAGVPPGEIVAARWIVLFVCVLGLLAEFAWLVRAVYLARPLRREAWDHSIIILAAVTAVAGSLADLGILLRLLPAGLILATLVLPVVRGRFDVMISVSATALAVILSAWTWLVVVFVLPTLVVGVRRLIHLGRDQRALS